MRQRKNGFGRKERWDARSSGHVLHERRIRKNTNLKREQKFTHLVLFGSDRLETNFQDLKPINLWAEGRVYRMKQSLKQRGMKSQTYRAPSGVFLTTLGRQTIDTGNKQQGKKNSGIAGNKVQTVLFL